MTALFVSLLKVPVIIDRILEATRLKFAELLLTSYKLCNKQTKFQILSRR